MTTSGDAAVRLPAIARAGFRAVAIDLRGYGDSSQPSSVEECRVMAHVADNIAVVRALGEQTAIVIGHDVGATIAANSALLRPDVFTRSGWLDRDAAELERTGLAGPLARYRNFDRDWEDLAAWDGAPIRQPSLFIGGALDPPPRGWPTRSPPSPPRCPD